MQKSFILLALPLLLAECTTARLRTSTVSQAGSLTELQYQQVLNNLAMFSANPEFLPSMVNVKDGSAQVADVGSASYLGDWYRAFKSHPMVLGSRTVVEQWSMSPVTNDNELQLLQLAYRRAVGIDETLEQHRDLANDLAHEFVKQLPEVDDYRGSIQNQYEDFKNYARRSSNPRAFDLKSVLDYIFDPGNNYLAYLNAQNSAGGERDSLYSEFQEHSISSIDKVVVFENELIRIMDIYTNYSEIANYKGRSYYINAWEIRSDFDNPATTSKLSRADLSPPSPAPPSNYWPPYLNSPAPPANGLRRKFLAQVDPMKSPDPDDEIWYVTPEAASARRLVKETELDLLAITCDRRWYGCGGKHDVPHDACFVGHFGNCYVWVRPDGLKELSTLTIKTQKFSHLIKDDAVLTVPGPRYTPASGFPSL